MSDETEMLDGVKILLDRMEMFPEEFVARQHGGTHKWTEIIQYGMIGVLTDKEKQLLEEGLKKATRKVFSQRVAANIMYIENETLKPTRPMKPTTPPQQTTPRPPAFPNGAVTIATTGYSIASQTNPQAGHSAVAYTHTVKDSTGYLVAMHEHEYKYYLKQDPKRQQSYLDWIKRGRP